MIPAPQERPFVRVARVLTVVALGAFMAAMDSNIVNLALPTIKTALHAPVAVVAWTISLYLLVLTSTFSTAGRFSDRKGHKFVYLVGFGLFALGSVGAGLSWGIVPLLVARAFQALGGAMATVNGIALMRMYLPADRLSLGFGIWEGSVSIAMLVGPIAGGLIVAFLGWRWIFFINGPIAVVAILLGLIWLPHDQPRPETQPFDLGGSAALMTGLTGVIAAVTLTSAYGTQLLFVVIGVAGLVLLGAYVTVERRHRAPIIELSLFENPVFLTATFSKIFAYGTLFAMLLSIPFFLERVTGLSPALTGRDMIPMPVGMALGSLISGWIATKAPARFLSFLGMCLTSAGAAGLVFTDHPETTIGFFFAMAVAIFGLGLYITPNDSLITRHVPPEKAGMAGGIVAMMRSLGMICGATVASVVLQAGSASTLSSPQAYHPLFETIVALALAGTVLTGLTAMLGGARPHHT